MNTTADETVDQTIRERFETVFPDGTVSPAFIDARGRQVIMPGNIDPERFAQETNTLIRLSQGAGLLQEGAHLHGHVVYLRQVRTTIARPELDEDGQLLLDWNVRADEPGVIPVTLVEI